MREDAPAGTAEGEALEWWDCATGAAATVTLPDRVDVKPV